MKWRLRKLAPPESSESLSTGDNVRLALCSGDIYEAVLKSTPACVAATVSVGESVAFVPASVRRAGKLRQTEVEHLHRSIRLDLHVAGLNSESVQMLA